MTWVNLQLPPDNVVPGDRIASNINVANVSRSGLLFKIIVDVHLSGLLLPVSDALDDGWVVAAVAIGSLKASLGNVGLLLVVNLAGVQSGQLHQGFAIHHLVVNHVQIGDFIALAFMDVKNDTDVLLIGVPAELATDDDIEETVLVVVFFEILDIVVGHVLIEFGADGQS